jgi:hypothetical protein
MGALLSGIWGNGPRIPRIVLAFRRQVFLIKQSFFEEERFFFFQTFLMGMSSPQKTHRRPEI